MMEITRVFDILELYKTQYKKEDVLSSKVNKEWKKFSSQDLINNVNNVSHALLALGLSDKDKVAIISNNRPEWNFCDYGCQQANIVVSDNTPIMMTGIDATGFYLKVGEKIVYIAFVHSVTTAQQVREMLVAMVKSARKSKVVE